MFCMSSEKEICIAREKARPVLSRVLSALLRSSVMGYFNWQRDILATSEWASAASACGPCRRSNPEDVKQILRRHGVLIEAVEFTAIRKAYSDSVGFILTDIMLSNLEPLSHLPAAVQAQIKCVNTSQSNSTSNNNNTCNTNESNEHHGNCAQRNNSKQDKIILITQKVNYLVLDEVKEMVSYLGHALQHDKHLNASECSEEEQVDHVGDNSTITRKDSNDIFVTTAEIVREDADELFCTTHYPLNLVPLSDVFNFIAAECLLILECNSTTYVDHTSSIKAASIYDVVRKTSKAEKMIKPREAAETWKATDANGNNNNSISNGTAKSKLNDGECSMRPLIAHFQECAEHLTVLAYTHAELTELRLSSEKNMNGNSLQRKADVMQGSVAPSQRKFERYCSLVNRRDEWLRGRDERDARDTYQRHVVGYGGHLPEYQYHFGRTFHIIEEDLPKLSHPKTNTSCHELQRRYGDGETIALRRNCMNEHHFKLS